MKAKIIKRVARPAAEWIEKFKSVPSSIASDCLNRYYGMSGEIRPIFEGIRLCGPAVTIQSMSGNNLMSHYALTFAEPGDVLVIDALYAAKRGVAGLVVDGAIRDVEDMRRMRFPVFCKGFTPAGPHKGWADSVNVPVQCGGMPVHPGDLIIGDDDGVTVVPLALLQQVYEESIRRMEMEASWYEKIEKGQSSLDAVGLRNLLDQMEIETDE
jgi:regulator of RNase E activity RraA